MEISRKIMRDAGFSDKEMEYQYNFDKYAKFVSYVVKDVWTKKQKKAASGWLKEWAEAWRALYQDWEKIRASDPMAFYVPKHRVAYEFHSSPAFIRYFCAGNRTSKTQSGYAEHYLTVTGQHKWRSIASPPHDTFIIGINFSKYAGAVFETKFLTGEQDNPLSPMFPEGGKWLHHYDEKKHAIWISCPRCAAAGRARSCSHRKSRIRLYSDDSGWEVLQGASFVLGHFDEHIGEEFFTEALQRVQAARSGSIVVTGTPLFGFEAWEYHRLQKVVETGGALNRMVPENPNSPPLVSMHMISQFDAGIVDHDRIKMSMRTMDDFEIESRIYGRPAPLAENPVFDRIALTEMKKLCVPAVHMELVATKDLSEITDASQINMHPLSNSPLRLWDPPQPGTTYLAACDTAAGLAPRVGLRAGDASCCSILSVKRDGLRIKLKLVAQYHGWANPFDYAAEIFKLCVWYNSALCVVELTGGLGRAVVLKLRELAYWNIFRDRTDPEIANAGQDPKFGVDTSISTKPLMVGALQQLVREKLIEIPCADTIREMVAFEQERSKTGLTTRYQGAGGAHDDRVMSLVIGAGVAISYPVYEFSSELENVAKSIGPDYNAEWKSIHEEMDSRMQELL
jgi:hypothetical protein